MKFPVFGKEFCLFTQSRNKELRFV